MATRIKALMNCVGRLTPERRAVVDRAYVEARAGGKGDGEAAEVALALLTDAEKDASGVYEVSMPVSSAKAARR
jgi:hypothetical protein